MKILEVALGGIDPECKDIFQHLGAVMETLSQAEASTEETYKCSHKRMDGEAAKHLLTMFKENGTLEDAILTTLKDFAESHAQLQVQLVELIQQIMTFSDLMLPVLRQHPNRELAVLTSSMVGALRSKNHEYMNMAFEDEGFESPALPEYYFAAFQQLRLKGPHISLEDFCSSFADGAVDNATAYLKKVHSLGDLGRKQDPASREQFDKEAEAIAKSKDEFVSNAKVKWTEVDRAKN